MASVTVTIPTGRRPRQNRQVHSEEPPFTTTLLHTFTSTFCSQGDLGGGGSDSSAGLPGPAPHEVTGGPEPLDPNLGLFEFPTTALTNT